MEEIKELAGKTNKGICLIGFPSNTAYRLCEAIAKEKMPMEVVSAWVNLAKAFEEQFLKAWEAAKKVIENIREAIMRYEDDLDKITEDYPEYKAKIKLIKIDKRKRMHNIRNNC